MITIASCAEGKCIVVLGYQLLPLGLMCHSRLVYTVSIRTCMFTRVERHVRSCYYMRHFGGIPCQSRPLFSCVYAISYRYCGKYRKFLPDLL